AVLGVQGRVNENGRPVMLFWSKPARLVIWALFFCLFGLVFALPLLTLILASFSGQWTSVLPSYLTVRHFAQVLLGPSADNLVASLITALVASIISLILGTWAALAIRNLRNGSKRVMDMVFLMPIAVPSVSVGLGLLVTFSQPPILLNGTLSMVLIAHVVLVTAFAFSNVSAGLARLPQDQEQVAASLGASPAYVLLKVTLPLLTSQLVASASLPCALSMGDLEA